MLESNLLRIRVATGVFLGAIIGLGILASTGLTYAQPAIRSLEADLPDYATLESES